MTTDPTPANAPSDNITETPAAPTPSTSVVAETPAAPLPATPPAPAPASPTERPAPAWVAKIDYLLLGCLLLLSFFVASFAATNSDLWLNLAIGKRISEGKFEFGADPYSWTTEATGDKPAVPWIHQSWLYSWLVYQIHESALGGGGGLIFLKAILFTIAVGLLSRIGWNGPNRWFVLICLLLAVLAASSRLHMQPIVFSLLFLALTLFVLDRAGIFCQAHPQESLRSSNCLWVLPPLFALWTNLDAWFILGPIVLGLCWAAAGLGRWFVGTRHLPGRQLGLVFGGGVLACLLNPYHVHVFQLPPELAYLLVTMADPLRIPLPAELVAGGRALKEMRRIEPEFSWTLATVSSAYWKDPRFGLSIAGLALAPLVLLGLLGFTLMALVKPQPKAPTLHAGRFLLWLIFVVMALTLYRMIPFFALIAAPLTALTLGEFVQCQQTNSAVPVGRRDRALMLARFVSIPFLLFLLFLAWPGWLQGTTEFTSPRHVAWELRVDPSLQKAAESLRELRQADACKNVFNANFDLGNYLPWFAPEVKYCMDTRFTLYADAVGDYSATRDALNGMKPDADWQATFKKHDVDQIVMTNFFAREQLARLVRRWLDGPTWRQRYGDRRTIVFSWAGPDKPWPIDQATSDLNRQAFGAVPPERRPPVKGTLPQELPDIWVQYLDGLPPQPLGVAEADLWQKRFDVANLLCNGNEVRGCGTVALCASLAGWQALPGGGMSVDRAALAMLVSRMAPLSAEDFGPPAAPILMVRSARQAIAENPLSAAAYLALAQATVELRRNQEDRWIHHHPQLPHPFKHRDRLRQLQHIAAMLQVVQLRPDEPSDHMHLAALYERENLLDLALDHMQLAMKAIEAKRSAVPAAALRQFDGAVKADQDKVDKLDRDVKQRLSKWKEISTGKPAFAKAYLAFYGPFDVLTGNRPEQVPLGLAKKALELLPSVEVDSLKTDSEKLTYVKFHYDLLLSMGRADLVAKELSDERAKKSLGDATHAQYQLWAAGALGDYQGMDQALTTIETTLRAEAPKVRPLIDEQAQRCVPYFFEAGTESSLPGLKWTLLSRTFPAFMQVTGVHDVHERLRGELCNNLTLHGSILLEAGETKRANALFQAALSEGEGARYFGERPIARRYRELLEAQKKP